MLSMLMPKKRRTDSRKPTEIDDAYWVFHFAADRGTSNSPVIGKWLVFKHYDLIDETWEKIKAAMSTDSLGGCPQAKSSTLRYNPSGSGPGPTTNAVICVYTGESNMDDIGFKLIELVRQNICYKTDAATRSRKYSYIGGTGRIASKTLYWNEGKPSFTRCVPSRREKKVPMEDKWQMNVVKAPEPTCSEEAHGKWILYLDNQDLTHIWHSLKDRIKSDRQIGVIKMVCPSKGKYKSQMKKPCFQLFTNRKAKDAVGMYLINKFARDDIYYEHEMQDGKPWTETLYWNDGKPDYDSIEK